MLRPASYLSRKLTRAIHTKDGGTLRTIGEACDYMTGMETGAADALPTALQIDPRKRGRDDG
jgi:hypothetical protein